MLSNVLTCGTRSRSHPGSSLYHAMRNNNAAWLLGCNCHALRNDSSDSRAGSSGLGHNNSWHSSATKWARFAASRRADKLR